MTLITSRIQAVPNDAHANNLATAEKAFCLAQCLILTSVLGKVADRRGGRQMKSVEEILATAIEFEKFGVEYYTKFQELVGDEKAKALMRSLASDEKEHASILDKQLKALGGKAPAVSQKTLDKGLSEIFPGKAKKNSIAVTDSISAIKMGIGTEERSYSYYSKNAKSVDRRLKDIFEKLAKMEQGHRELLEENLRYLENDGSWFGYVPILEG